MFLQLVPQVGGRYGPEGSAGFGVRVFPPLQPGPAGRRKNYGSESQAPDLGSHPLQDRTCPRGLAPSARPRKGRFGGRRELRDHPSTADFIWQESEELSPCPAPVPGPGTHRCSARSRRGGWRPRARRRRGSPSARAGTGSCTPGCPGARPRGCWAAGRASSCTAPSGGW